MAVLENYIRLHVITKYIIVFKACYNVNHSISSLSSLLELQALLNHVIYKSKRICILYYFIFAANSPEKYRSVLFSGNKLVRNQFTSTSINRLFNNFIIQTSFEDYLVYVVALYALTHIAPSSSFHFFSLLCFTFNI